MYNPYSYVSSSLSLRCKGSLSYYPLNDQSYFPNENKYHRHLVSSSSSSFSPSCCCACCDTNYVYKVPINPRICYGSRQSSLIHWSASRRIAVGGPDPYCCRAPVSDSCRKCCCGHVCNEREMGFGWERRRRLGEGRFRRMVSKGRSCNFEDAEMLISLMIEEVEEESYGVRERKYGKSRRVGVERKGSEGDDTYMKTKNNVRNGEDCRSYTKTKKNEGSGLSKREPKSGFGYVRIESRDEDDKRKDDRRIEKKEILRKGEKNRGLRSTPSCSSYYTCSSLGESESDVDMQVKDESDSDTEVQIRNEAYGEELSRRFKRDLKEREKKVSYNAETVEDLQRREDAVGSRKTLEFDWRKKSEKKLDEENSSENRKRFSEIYETSAHKQFDSTKKDSNLSMTDSGSRQSRKSAQVVQQSETKTKQKQFSERTNADVVSSSKMNFSKRDEKSTVAGNLVHEKRQERARTDDHVRNRSDDYRLSTQKSNQVEQIQDIDVKRTDNSQKQFEAKVNRREDKSSVISSSAKDTENRYYSTSEDNSRLTESRMKSQRLTGTSATEKHARLDKQVVHGQSDQQAVRENEFKRSQAMSTKSLGQSSNTQVTNIKINSTSEIRTSSQEKYSSSMAKSNEESTKLKEMSESRISQSRSRKETEDTSLKASSSQASLVLETTPKLPRNTVNMGNTSGSQATVMAPQSRILNTSPHSGPNSDAPSSQQKIFEGSTMVQTQAYEDPLTPVSQEDALGSAHRFQESSSQIVGEFLEQVTNEATTSQAQKNERASEELMVIEGHKQGQKSSSEYGYVDFKSRERDSSRSSRSSGVKGPSDEIWDEMGGPSVPESIDTRTQVPEITSPTQSLVVTRTGRSLWNIFSDVVRLRWSSRSKTPVSTPKSGVKSSPNQSNSSETWFSGRDRDETSEENRKRGKKSLSRESILTPTGSQGEGYVSSSSSKNKLGTVGVDVVSSSSKTPIESTTPQGSPIISTEENVKMGGPTMVESSVSMPTLRLGRSPNVDEVFELDKTKTNISGSGSFPGKEQLIVPMPSNVLGSEGKVGEMKRRSLQRTNQVIKDRFDEWEEAFTLETEQRKIDEAFMREALLEAKKAGDMWEVPVGAILVQNGKIIARGYNLVEELRDSTAHAEMICIREASNQLRTWRLSETTLYVTLEPCPMCAGAILQARIDTVVWGAPNKLLGADGSWIRLFPCGAESGSSSESTDNKPPAPVHPFHPKIVIRRGVLATECADVMQLFFQLRRRKKEKKQQSSSDTTPPPTPPSCLPISNHPTKIFTKMNDAFHFMLCL